MKIGKKLWTIALLCCLALTLGLAGCGGNTDGGKTDGPGDTSATYSVTLMKNFTGEMGTAALSAPASGGKYAKDELVTLTVTVNDGFTVDGVTVGSETVELEGGKYSFKVKEDTAVTVTLRAIAYYGVTLQKEGNGGTAKIAPDANADGKYLENSEITLTVTEQYGYKASVTVNGESVTLTDGAYVFQLEKDTTVAVTFAERVKYKVTATFDAKMCDVAYSGKLEDGNMGNIPLVSEVAADIYEGETVFTAIPKGGYKIVSVTVDGQAATLQGNGFTVDIGKNIAIGVECVWDVKSLTSLAGEFDLADDVWYTFTLERSVFDFTANNYVAYASFYKVETVEEPEHGEDGDKPVWTFNDDDRTIQAVHAFEAGLYVARFTSNTGDGVGGSKLAITQVELLSFELPEIFCGSWQSTDVVENDSDADDHIWSMYVDTDCFVLKKKDSGGVYRIVDATVTTEGGEYFVEVGGNAYAYVLMPAYNLVGTLSLYDNEPIVFLPNPLPDIKPPKALAGTYEGTNEEDEAVADLTVTENGVTWDGKPLTLLAEISLGGGMMDPSAGYTAALYEGKLYAIMAQQMGPDSYMIILIDSETSATIMFMPKAGISIAASFQGTWKCLAADKPLTGYTLEITADNIVVKDANGQVIEATVGITARYNVDYVSFTINGATYLLQRTTPGLNNTTNLTVLSLSDNKSISFVKQA